MHIQRVLEMRNGNRGHASQVLSNGRTSLYRFLKHDKAGSGARERRCPARLCRAVKTSSVGTRELTETCNSPHNLVSGAFPGFWMACRSKGARIGQIG
jgi:hypothetical protein